MDNAKTKVVIIENDETAKNLFGVYLSSLCDVECLATFKNIAAGIDFILDEKPEIIIMDVDNDFEFSLHNIEKISQNGFNCRIIATSYKQNSSDIIRLMRAGAKDFLLKPITEKEFFTCIEKNQCINNSGMAMNEGSVIAVYSNKGGMGKTSISVNLAFELANLTKEKVLIVDSDFAFGDVATFLDIAPSYELSYVFDCMNDIDCKSLYNLTTQYKNTNLYVLSDIQDKNYQTKFTQQRLKDLFCKLKKSFAYVIVDCGNNEADNGVAFDVSDNIFVVTCANLPSLNNTQRCLNFFNSNNYDFSKIKIILNRYIENDEVSIESLENTINNKIFWKIPNNYILQMSAINKGVAISEINSETNISQSYKNFAALVSQSLR